MVACFLWQNSIGGWLFDCTKWPWWPTFECVRRVGYEKRWWTGLKEKFVDEWLSARFLLGALKCIFPKSSHTGALISLQLSEWKIYQLGCGGCWWCRLHFIDYSELYSVSKVIHVRLITLQRYAKTLILLSAFMFSFNLQSPVYALCPCRQEWEANPTFSNIFSVGLCLILYFLGLTWK